MNKNLENINQSLEQLFENFADFDFIRSDLLPNIDLYMDQVTTFMDCHLEKSKRYPEDKILTKTMINNYTKNNLLPPPDKKKYSKDHMLLLIFIYYFKNLLSIGDIQQVLDPLEEKYFKTDKSLNLEDIYNEISLLKNQELEHISPGIRRLYEDSMASFEHDGTEDEDKVFLKLFAFISLLSYDVNIKKQLVERIIDRFFRPDEPDKKK